jgi:tight adherence protein B
VSSTDELLLVLGAVFLASGVVAALALLIGNPRSPLRARWAAYRAELDAEIKFLFLDTTSRKITTVQLVICGALVVLALLMMQYPPVLLIPIVLYAPMAMLKKRHDDRVLDVQRQLDTWLVMLSNALKASPSLGEGISATARLMHPPMSQELDITMKEVHLGTPLDQAVLTMGARIQSKAHSGAITTILVGRQTGGDLSRILEESAAMLREMGRLEGVIRTKTAEAKAQTWVLAAMPFLLVGALYYIDREWLDPLWSSVTGNLIVASAFGMWLASVLLARKTLRVDI